MFVLAGLVLCVIVSEAIVWARRRLVEGWRLLGLLQDALDRDPLAYGTRVFVTPLVFRPTRVVLAAGGVTQEGRDRAVSIVHQTLAGLGYSRYRLMRQEIVNPSRVRVGPRAGVGEV